MATKKHRKKRVGAKRRHHRRMGAKGRLEKVALTAMGVAAGGIIAPFVINAGKTALGSAAASVPAWMVPAAVAAVGAAGLYFAEGNAIGSGIAAGMLAMGAVEVANEAGLNEPGISGLSAGSNSAPGTRHLTNAVGCRKVAGPDAYLSSTVGSSHGRMRKAMAVGALISD
jgi:hypothetical protein